MISEMNNTRFPASVIWEFTLACNLNCIHCGSSAGGERDDELSTAEAEAVCLDLKKTGCRLITLMGGEPLLREDFWQIAALIRELGMELSVITNGTVYGDETFSRLGLLAPRNVAVSLDAAEPGLHDRIRCRAGAFEKTTDFMARAQKERLPVSVITTVHKMNLRELAAIREMLLGRNIAWQIQIAGSEGRRFPEELLLDEEEFYSVGMFIASTRKKYPLKQRPVTGAHDLGFNSMMLGNVSLDNEWTGCQAGLSVLGIQSDGNIKGCLSMSDDAVEGNIRNKSIYELWNSDTAFSYSRKFAVTDAGENCRQCEHVRKCRGGCNEMSLMKTGRLHNDPYCFCSIERRIFRKELKNPFFNLKLKAGAGLKRLLMKKR